MDCVYLFCPIVAKRHAVYIFRDLVALIKYRNDFEVPYLSTS